MPEGPECYLNARLLDKQVKGKALTGAITHPTGRYSRSEPPGCAKFFHTGRQPIKINQVVSRGKLIYWLLDSDYVLASTLGMTGQWAFNPTKHLCLTFTLDDGSFIYFNDQRHFGTISFIPTTDLNKKIKGLQWDPLRDSSLNSPPFPRTEQPIGDYLLNQKYFSGVGNYIRAEALYRAKINPWTPSCQLDPTQYQELLRAVTKIMTESLAAQGASFKTYRDANGDAGNFASFFQVYGQKTDPLGNPIERTEMPGGRTIHWVPAIQGSSIYPSKCELV